MTRRGDASKCFCATYTSQGYMTLLAQNPGCYAGQVILVRGGSQAARSKVMEQAADSLLDRGFCLEVFRNWIDPSLISGFRLTSPALSVLDDELREPRGGEALISSKVIDISPAWDYGQMQSHKKALCTLSWQITRRIQITASYLRELGTILEESKGYVCDSMDFPRVNRTTQLIISEIFERQADTLPFSQSSSRLFVTAITSNGFDYCVNTLVSGYRHFYLFRGEPGSGRSTILARVAEQAAMRGLPVRSFHGPLEPDRLEVLLIPSLATALIGGVAARGFCPTVHRSLATLKVVELGELMRKKRLALLQPEWLAAKRRFDEMVQVTTEQLSRCKQINETIAAIYQEYVDQTRLNPLTAQLLRYMLDLIDHRR